MPDKKNIILTILIFVIFFLLFPLKINSNLRYQSDAAAALESSEELEISNKIPYVYDKSAGYFSRDLESIYRFDIKDGVTLLSDSYVNYSKDHAGFDIVSLNGNIEYSVKQSGYPFSINNRLFLIGSSRKVLSEVVNGSIAWSHSFNYIITSIDANDDDVVVGFDKGNFLVIDSSGRVYFNYEPGGSRISIVYSVKISEDGRYIACISGLDPQRFIIYEKKDREFKPVNVFNLKDDIKKSLKLFITSENRKVFIEGLGGFYVVEIDSKNKSYIEDSYNLKNVKYLKEFNIYFIHTAASNYNRIKLLTDDNRILMERSFISEGVTVSSEEDSLYIVLDNSVVKLKIEDDK